MNLENQHYFTQSIVNTVLSRVKDMWPTRCCVGGSYALHQRLPAIQPKDVDIYISLNITRCMLMEVLEKVIFADYNITVTSKPMGNHEYYKMPHMRKRISITAESRLTGQKQDFDFILFEENDKTQDIVSFVLANQASTLTEIVLEPSFNETKPWPTRWSEKFDTVRTCGYVELDPTKATEQHVEKIKYRCAMLGFNLSMI